MIDAAGQLALQQFEELEPQRRVVVVHPNYPHQHSLMYSFLQERGCLYLRLDGSDLNRRIFIEHLLPQQMPGKSPVDVRVLILDEWDRADPTQLEAFLMEMLDAMDGHIILFGRGTPEFTYQDSGLRQKVAFVPTDSHWMLTDFSRLNNKSIMVEVHTLGRIAVSVNGRPIVDWEGDLPRSLFLYLVDSGIVRRGDIFRAFWPELKIQEATNVFHVTKRKLSEVLGIDLTSYWSGFYRLSPQIELVYDAELFSDTVRDSTTTSTDEAQQLLAKAIECYHGDYLVSFDSTIPWVNNRRSELRKTYGEALIALARLVEQSADTVKALGYYVRAFATNPQREDIAGSIMKIYAEQGLYADALAIYHQLETELMNNLNISPTHRIQRLAADIRAKATERVYTP
jgi:DNA-binding SARP family transcriptional activator